MSTPIAERLAKKIEVDPESGCWYFTGKTGAQGYGQIIDSETKKPVRVHRFIWEHYHGEVPPGHQVRHGCRHVDGRRCVNPEHLYLLAQREGRA